MDQNRELMKYIDNTISYMNYCKRRADEEFKSKPFNERDYILNTERFITLMVTISDLLKIFDVELVEEDGIYKPIKLTK